VDDAQPDSTEPHMTKPDMTKPDITPDQFFAVDMRVGRVLTAEPFPQARRPAFKLTVDFGPLGTRQTSAQIAQYEPSALVGSLVVGAMNLGAKRIAGFRSEFLILGAIGPEGIVRLLRPDAGAIPGEQIA
jgi:tRNA-binding protein